MWIAGGPVGDVGHDRSKIMRVRLGFDAEVAASAVDHEKAGQLATRILIILP